MSAPTYAQARREAVDAMATSESDATRSARLYAAALEALGAAHEAPHLPALQRDALAVCVRLLDMAADVSRREANVIECVAHLRAAVRILLDCQHGDKATCGCRDAAEAHVAATRRERLTR